MNIFAETLAWLMNPERWSGPTGIPVAIAQHLGFTFLSVLIAALIAIPAGWAIGHTGKGREIAVAISGAARAIPSFGLLVLLVLLMGVLQTQTAAVITFVLLGIPSILAGAYAGFEAIDRRVIDAGRAMGMTEWQILWRIEVPLGLPLLVSGLRAATLQIVATVTIAAYVGLGGLGLFIIQGINLNRFDQVLAGALLVAILALVLDGLFALAERLVVPRGVLAGRTGGAGPARDKRRGRVATETSAQPSAAENDGASAPSHHHRSVTAPPHREKNSTMNTAKKRLVFGAALAATAALVLAGCSSSNPLEEESAGGEAASDTIVVGSQAYYSNEIIAEIYAQALEGAGFEVERQFNIGQRDAYMPEIESGAITLFPEYSGNLLQYFDSETAARTPDEVYAALQEALPDNLTVLDQSEASDQDSYTVTAAFADEYSLAAIGDLANVSVPLTLGGPPELAERPYGPTGLADVYGVDVTFSPTGDTTVENLVAGTVNVANVFTADPRIQTQDLVVLEDPEGLFLASNVVPVVSADVADEIADVINAVSAALTADALVALNVQSTEDQMSPDDIAAAFLEENGLV